MIINTGMRTDIPAFYSKWLLNRIKEGFVYVRNPYYKHQVTKYSLSPNVVDCLAFCTKNPHPLIFHLSELDKYKQFWFITITPNLRPPTPKEQIEIAKVFSKIGKKNNITIHACCEKEDLKDYGIDITGCMSQEIVEKAIQNKLHTPKNNSKRTECNCLMGNDIGAYNTCMHLCKYCYANANQGLVKENVKKHNPNSPFLIGELEEGDKITEAKQKSWIIGQNEQISFI